MTSRSCTGALVAPAENLEHTLFYGELRFVTIYALFGDLWAKKVPFWVKNSVSSCFTYNSSSSMLYSSSSAALLVQK